MPGFLQGVSGDGDTISNYLPTNFNKVFSNKKIEAQRIFFASDLKDIKNKAHDLDKRHLHGDSTVAWQLYEVLEQASDELAPTRDNLKTFQDTGTGAMDKASQLKDHRELRSCCNLFPLYNRNGQRFVAPQLKRHVPNT